MMRPNGFYAIFENGRVTAIVEGYTNARRISPQRCYRRCASRLHAEEFAAHWNYDREAADAERAKTPGRFLS